MPISLPWDEYARALGYQNEFDMLFDYANDPKKSYTELADKLGVYPPSLVYRRKIHGVRVNPTRGGANNTKKTSKNYQERAIKLGYKDEIEMFTDLKLAQNKSYMWIGQKLSVSHTTIKNRMVKLGIVSSNYSNTRYHYAANQLGYKDEIEMFTDLKFNKKYGCRKIATMIGLTETAVVRRLEKIGLLHVKN